MLMQRLRGTRFKHWVDAYRAYSYWRSSGSIFIHVPKAAGTSVNHAIYGRTLGHFTAAELQQRFPRLYARSFVFSLTRNPWSRALSAYRFAKAGRTDSMGVANPSQYKIPAFQSFEHFLFDWLLKQNLNDVDFVFQPQHRFLTDDKREIIVDFVGKVEMLNEDMDFVSQKIGRTVEVGYANRTALNADYTQYYHDQDMIDLISNLYAEDINLFGYRFGS